MKATKRSVGDELTQAEDTLRIFNERRAEANKAYIEAMLARRKMTGDALTQQLQLCRELGLALDAATQNYVNAKGRVEVLHKELKYRANKAKSFSPNGRRIRL